MSAARAAGSIIVRPSLSFLQGWQGCLMCDSVILGRRVHDAENPKIVVGCIAEHEGKILICKRGIEPGYGLWGIPAGWVVVYGSVGRSVDRRALACVRVFFSSLYMYERSSIIVLPQSPSIGAVSAFSRLLKACRHTRIPHQQ